MTTTDELSGRRPSVSGRALWLRLDPEPIYGVLHSPPAESVSKVAAVMLPTFGWENECSYRARRDWATALALAGVPTLRFDLPGTEDSVGSALQPGRLASWVGAATDAANWLREASDCERLVFIGVGLGGIIAYQAAAEGAPVDDLILWAVRSSGRAYIREQQSFAAIATGGTPDGRDSAREDGLLALAGHRMSAETAQALADVDLTALEIPWISQRRVLLIGRDGSGVDRRLREHLEHSEVELTVLDADDYRLFVMVPDMMQSPAVTIERSVRWILEGADDRPDPASWHAHSDGAGPQAADEIEFEYGGVLIRERLIEIPFADGFLSAIVTEPLGVPRLPLCSVSVNSAWLRRTGPGRLMVEAARRAAAAGLVAARIDLPGMGDSDGDTPKVYERYQEHNLAAAEALRACFDSLQALGFGERFVPLGLCLGGYIAALSATSDPRVVGMVGLNAQLGWGDRQRQWQRRWAEELHIEEGLRRLDVAAGEGRWSMGRIQARLRRRLQDKLGPTLMTNETFKRIYWFSYTRSVSRLLQTLGAKGIPVLLISASNEGLMLDLRRGGPRAKVISRWPNIRVQELLTESHLLYPLWSQDEALSVLSTHLLELAAARVAAAPSARPRPEVQHH